MNLDIIEIRLKLITIYINLQFSISSIPCVADGDYDGLTHIHAEGLKAPAPEIGKPNTCPSYIY